MVAVKVVSDALTIELVGDLLFKVGEVELMFAVLDVTQEFGAFAHKEGPSSEKIAGGTKRSGVNIGDREHAALEQGGDAPGIHAVVLDLGAVDSAHVEGMAKDELDVMVIAEISEPVPVKCRFDADDEVLAVGLESVKDHVGIGGQVSMQLHSSLSIEHAEVE